MATQEDGRAGTQYPPALAQYPDRIGEEEEHHRHRQRAERVPGKRQVLGGGPDHARAGSPLPGQPGHLSRASPCHE